MKKWLVLVFLSFLLQGCSADSFKIPVIDEDKILITHMKEPLISVIDTSKNEVIHEENIDYYIDSSVRLDEEHIIFAGIYENEVKTLNLKTGETTLLLKDTEAISDLFLDEEEQILYLSNAKAGEVIVFQLKDKAIEKRIKVGAYPSELALHNNMLYVLNEHDSTITIVDTEGLTIKETFPVLENPTDIIILADENEIWVGGHGAYGNLNDSIYVYHLDSGDFITQIRTGSMPIDLFTDTHSNEVFILSHGSNDLHIIEKSTKELIGQVETGLNPYQITGDKQFIYITALDGDELMIINRSDYSIEQTYPLAAGPYGIILGGDKHE